MIQLVRPSRGHVTQWYAATQVDGNPHAGQDYAYSNGSEIFPEVYAAADGVVLFAGDSRGLTWPNIMYLNPDFDRSDNVDTSAGNYTILAHYVDGVMVAMTGYGHQEEVWVKAGQSVSAGQRIGTVGATGFSAGKHLHFDLVLAPFRVNVAPFYGRVDPNPYFVSSLSYAGTITPIQQEDELSAQEVLAWPIERTDGQESTVAVELAKIGPDNQALQAQVKEMFEFLKGVNEKVDEVQGNARKTFWNSEESKNLLQSAPPAQLAADINAAGLAESVRDELVKLLGGAK